MSPLSDVTRDPQCRLEQLWEEAPAITSGVYVVRYPHSETTLADAAFEVASSYFTAGSETAADDMLFTPLYEWAPLRRLAGARESRRFSDRFDELRARLRLPAYKYALLLGTTRRTLYHWLDTDRPHELAEYRLDRLMAWRAELDRYLSSPDVLHQFDPELPGSVGALLVELGEDAARARLDSLLAPPVPRRARRLPALATGGTEADLPTLDAEGMRSALETFSAPRHATSAPGTWTPPELMDADDAG